MKDTWEAQRRVIRANTTLAVRDSSLVAAYLELLVWEGNGSEALGELDTLRKGLEEWGAEDLPLIHQMTCAALLAGRASERAAAVARALDVYVYRVVNGTVTVPYLVELAQALLKRGKPPELLTVAQALRQPTPYLSFDNKIAALIGAIEPLARLGKQEEVTKIRRELFLNRPQPLQGWRIKQQFAILSSLQRMGQAREVATLVEATLTAFHAQGPFWGTAEEDRQRLICLAPFAQDRGNQQRLWELVERTRQHVVQSAGVAYCGATALFLSGRVAQAMERMQGVDQADYGALFCWLHAATLLQKRQGQALARLTKTTLERTRRDRANGYNGSALTLARLGDVLLSLGEEALARRAVSESLDCPKDRTGHFFPMLMFHLGTLLPRLGMLKEGLALFDDQEDRHFQDGVLYGLRRCGKDRVQEALALSASRKTLSVFCSCCEALVGNWQAAQAIATALTNDEPRLEAYVFLLRAHLRRTNATFRKDGPTGEPAWPNLYHVLTEDSYW